MGVFVDRLQHLLGRLAGRPLDVHQIHGFTVVVDNTRADIATADVLQRLQESVELVERFQPWRLRHLRRDLKHIRVMRYPTRGAYFPEHHMCMVELTFLARRDIGPATIAATIVHEGMHARVHRFSALGSRLSATARPETREEDRAREERICRRAELEFGQALPPEIGAPVVERALASLALSDTDVAPAIDWEEAMRRTNEVDGGR